MQLRRAAIIWTSTSANEDCHVVIRPDTAEKLGLVQGQHVQIGYRCPDVYEDDALSGFHAVVHVEETETEHVRVLGGFFGEVIFDDLVPDTSPTECILHTSPWAP